MLLTIELPRRDETIATLRTRWQAAVADPAYEGWSGKCESNAFGQIIVSPPPPGAHRHRAFRIACQLPSDLGGEAFTACPVLTIDGVKAADAAWYSAERFAQVRDQTAYEIAPEICVEVLSPCNTAAEMRHKRRLYFDAGALECWVCDIDGHMHYYLDTDPDTAHSHSRLCPDFPNPINP